MYFPKKKAPTLKMRAFLFLTLKVMKGDYSAAVHAAHDAAL